MQLPYDIIKLICTFLDVDTLLQFSQTSKTIYQLLSQHFWQSMLHLHYPHFPPQPHLTFKQQYKMAADHHQFWQIFHDFVKCNDWSIFHSKYSIAEQEFLKRKYRFLHKKLHRKLHRYYGWGDRSHSMAGIITGIMIQGGYYKDNSEAMPYLWKRPSRDLNRLHQLLLE